MSAPTVDAVLSETQDPSVRESMLIGSRMEGGWSPPFGVGDEGHSFGPYQINLPFHPGVSREQAEDPVWATDFMWPSYVSAMIRVDPRLWVTDPAHASAKAAYFAEKPAHMYPEERIQSAWADTVSAMRQAGAPLGPGGAGPDPPTGGDPGGGGSSSGGGGNATCPEGQEMLCGKCHPPGGRAGTGGLNPGADCFPWETWGSCCAHDRPVRTAVGAIDSVAKALAFVFSVRFLEVLAGLLLILVGVSALARQAGAPINVPGVPGA